VLPIPPGKEVGAIPRTRKAVAKPTANKTPDLLKIVETSLDDDKGEDIVVIDLRGKSTIADFMVIATGRNSRQLAAMATHLDQKLTKAGVKKISVEGANTGDWVLLDGGDVVVHLFRPEVRSFYALEKMWGAEMPTPERLTAVG
jgi:ribosome-associated protein